MNSIKKVFDITWSTLPRGESRFCDFDPHLYASYAKRIRGVGAGRIEAQIEKFDADTGSGPKAEAFRAVFPEYSINIY